MAYCKHAHRSTIELADVELLMKRFVLALHLSYVLIKKLHVIHMYFKEKYIHLKTFWEIYLFIKA